MFDNKQLCRYSLFAISKKQESKDKEQNCAAIRISQEGKYRDIYV